MHNFTISSTYTLVLSFVIGMIISHTSLSAPPSFQLATVCDMDTLKVQDYYISEKFDGVRAYWDGKHFYSRQGNIYNAPSWFTKDLPNTPLDGELWLDRGEFEILSSIVRQSIPDQRWKHVSYQVFDLPNNPDKFHLRYQILKKMTETEQMKIVQQHQFHDKKHLLKHLHVLDAQGGEGLMLHHKSAHYQAGRSPLLCKLKSYADDEAEVMGYKPGKGKYSGMTGALIVKNKQGIFINIGSGLTDKDRLQPPEIGAIITYRYNGHTINGLPRFPRFIRIRQDH